MTLHCTQELHAYLINIFRLVGHLPLLFRKYTNTKRITHQILASSIAKLFLYLDRVTIQSKWALLTWLWVKVSSEFNYSLLTESLVALVTVSPPRHCSLLIMQAVTIMSVKYTLIKIQNIDMIWPIFFQTIQIQTYWKRWIN